MRAAGTGWLLRLVVALASAWGLSAGSAHAELVTVRQPEGLVHGFLTLHAEDGRVIAEGDLTQLVHGGRVTTRLAFRFADGSQQEETAVFSQHGRFRLISDRLVQKGPSFPTPLQMSIDVASGRVSVEYSDHGQRKTLSRHFDLPPDLANGLIVVLLKNVDPAAAPRSFGLVVATPEPRVIKLAIAGAAERHLSIGGTPRTAFDFTLKPEIGGITGLLAPLVGRQPRDAHVLILRGEAPAFLSAEQQFYADGPLWRIELAAPRLR